MSTPNRIVIVVEGGIVQDVLTNHAADVYLIDYDTDGTTEKLKEIPQRNPKDTDPPHPVLAVAGAYNSEINPARTNQLVEAIEKQEEQTT